MSYTKGPWKVGEWIDDQEVMIDAPNGDMDLAFSKWSGLAVVYGSDDFRGGHEKAMANAHLIAAAPELLEALKHAKEMLELYELNQTGEAFNSVVINDAIAKAEGRS